MDADEELGDCDGDGGRWMDSLVKWAFLQQEQVE